MISAMVDWFPRIRFTWIVSIDHRSVLYWQKSTWIKKLTLATFRHPIIRPFIRKYSSKSSSVVNFIVSETSFIHFSHIDCVHVTSSFKGSAIQIAQYLVLGKRTSTHIRVYQPPSLGLFSISIERKVRILEKTTPSFPQNFLILVIILSLLDEVVIILVVVMKTE